MSCFIRTYVAVKRGPASTIEETLACPLTSLNLITEVEGTDRYRFNNGPKPGLPAAIFAYALIDAWDRHHPGQETLSLREILHGEGSPGRVFRLDDDAVLAYLDQVHEVTMGRLRFSDTAMIRQVVRSEPIRPKEVLDAYYQ